MRTCVSLIPVIDQKFVLLQLRDYRGGIRHPGVFSFFGGHVEEGESLQQALEREIFEELHLLLKGRDVAHYKTFLWEDHLPQYLELLRQQLPHAESFLGHNPEVLTNEAQALTDHLFVLHMTRDEAEKLPLHEGREAMILSFDAAKALLMTPLDKVMLLDYLAANHLLSYQQTTDP